jgi:hypothetical protein
MQVGAASIDKDVRLQRFISRSCRRALLNSTIPCRESSQLQLLTVTIYSTNRTSVVDLLRDQELVEVQAPVH